MRDTVQPKLVELVQDAIAADISAGKLQPGERVHPDALGRDLGVTGAPMQLALQALRDQGVLRDARGGGFQVAPLDLGHVRNIYDLRAAIEGLAFRRAAERNAERARSDGPPLIHAGRLAVSRGAMADIIDADCAFHDFIHSISGNPLVAKALELHWTNTQRVMGETLTRDERPGAVWDQHEAMLQAVCEADGDRAERLAREHIDDSARLMIARLKRERAELLGEDPAP